MALSGFEIGTAPTGGPPPDSGGEHRPSLKRALAMLDLFTPGRPQWTVEQLCAELGVAAPTAYRYVRELIGAGLILRLPGGRYALGPRIIELDYMMRQVDPQLQRAPPIMRELARRTGCDCVLTARCGDIVLDTHRESAHGPDGLAHGRGRRRSWLSGATPRALLAAQPSRWQRRFYEAHEEEIRSRALGESWPEFRAKMIEIARRGYYHSQGEEHPSCSGLAVAVPGQGNDHPTCAIAVIGASERFELLSLAQVIKLLREAAAELSPLVDAPAPSDLAPSDLAPSDLAPTDFA